jgi:hypothetical protein
MPRRCYELRGKFGVSNYGQEVSAGGVSGDNYAAAEAKEESKGGILEAESNSPTTDNLGVLSVMFYE